MRLHHHARTTSRRAARCLLLNRHTAQRRALSDVAAPAQEVHGERVAATTVDRVASSLLGWHWETRAPEAAELQHAAHFFRRVPPQTFYTASSLYQVPYTGLPEVAFLGRSNVGKSTLLNALLGAAVCRTSSKPGKTRALHAYAVGASSSGSGGGRAPKAAAAAAVTTKADHRPGGGGLLAVLDMPGYGHGSRAEWGKAVASYLARRKELRRAFLLVDALHGVKARDELMLDELRRAAVPHQVVLSKVDRVLFPQHPTGSRRLRQATLDANVQKLARLVDAVRALAQPNDPRAGRPALGEILCVSADLGRFKHLSDELPGGTLGINALRWSVLAATGLTGIGKRPKSDEDEDDEDLVIIDKSR